ncbi:enoyl-CoA hydratase [Chelativorans sp. AA-79]|uniref:enoyl-CoA hydratase n=1 Tax=Chelativorans sp. AA-79 TaxID=3028735 RepID=UPI0023F857D5|nr:enoyl-CoA hydratase [Chelativorans sp. AA-79]WEX12463.1 enoyl-CoA hydratase [Chelativorans sp. AA-79]
MSDILLDKADGIATITLNDPGTLNSLSEDMQFRLLDMVNRTAADSTVRVVVLTGAGRGFCSGGNVKKMGSKIEESMEVRAEVMLQKHQVSVRIQESPKVFIALVNGACFGAGLGLALACDFRLAAKSAKFGTAFAKIGLSGDFGVSWTLTKLVGSARAKEMMILGDPIDAPRAKEFGLVNDVCDDVELLDKGLQLAKRLAQGPSVAYGYIKKNLAASHSSTLAEIVQIEIRNQMQAFQTKDHREAVLAFSEKRQPTYTGT